MHSISSGSSQEPAGRPFQRPDTVLSWSSFHMSRRVRLNDMQLAELSLSPRLPLPVVFPWTLFLGSCSQRPAAWTSDRCGASPTQIPDAPVRHTTHACLGNPGLAICTPRSLGRVLVLSSCWPDRPITTEAKINKNYEKKRLPVGRSRELQARPITRRKTYEVCSSSPHRASMIASKDEQEKGAETQSSKAHAFLAFPLFI